MEFRQKVEEKFFDLHTAIEDAASAVKNCEDKLIIDSTSKNLVKCLYAVKVLAKTIDSQKNYGSSIQEEIKTLEFQLKEQQDLLSSLEKYKS